MTVQVEPAVEEHELCWRCSNERLPDSFLCSTCQLAENGPDPDDEYEQWIESRWDE